MKMVLFPYPGGKFQWMGELLSVLPQHDHYVSVFGGSGGDIFRKQRSPRETYNDLDPHVCNVFRVLQSENLWHNLAQRICVPHCRNIYDGALRILQQPIIDPVRSAAAFLIAAYQGKCTAHPCLKRPEAWWTYIENSHIRHWMTLPAVLPLIRDRFQQVQVEQNSWFACIRQHDSPTTLFFVDPPFFPGTVKTFYPIEMSVAEHRALLAILKRVEGFVILCNYNNELYRRELGNWKCIPRPMTGHINPNSRPTNKIGYTWMNFDPTTTPLWTP